MNLSVNYEELSMIARTLINKAGEFETLTKNVNTINNEISQVWQGVDAAKYLEAVKVQNYYMTQLASVIAEIGNYLNQVGSAYQEVSTNNQNSIQL